jgi:predicted short-subunit dehydrogenase-like oxidoreductase (DUF2520 family)
MIKVVLIGAGNVAVHLAKAFKIAKNVDFVQRYSRNNKNEIYFNKKTPTTDSLQNLVKADIYVIAINDDSVSSLSNKLPFIEGLVVHTSGSIPLTSLSDNLKRGVFYPLQTFSKNRDLNFENIPIAIETEFEKDKELLNNLAGSISNYVYYINSRQREKLHIAAIFANNFSNYMFTVAKSICDENNFSFDILKPLILETTNKLKSLDPEQAQTGPAKRNDKEVIEKHLSQLKNERKEIYSLISNSINRSN